MIECPVSGLGVKIKGLKCTHCPTGGDPTSQDILRENSDYILTSAGYSPSTLLCSNLATELCCVGEWGRFWAVLGVWGWNCVCSVSNRHSAFPGQLFQLFSIANRGSHPTWLSDRGSLSMFSALSQAQSGILRCFELGGRHRDSELLCQGRHCIILVCSGAECLLLDRAVSLSLA